METVSRDGTRIAFDRLGAGAPVVVVGGILQGRATYQRVADALARRLTVVNYDRRGRGDSGDTPPYAVEREVEDLAAKAAVAALPRAARRRRAEAWVHASGNIYHRAQTSGGG